MWRLDAAFLCKSGLGEFALLTQLSNILPDASEELPELWHRHVGPRTRSRQAQKQLVMLYYVSYRDAVDARSTRPAERARLSTAVVGLVALVASCSPPDEKPATSVVTATEPAESETGGTDPAGSSSTGAGPSDETASDAESTSADAECEHSMDCPNLLVCVDHECVSSIGTEFRVVVWEWDPNSCDDLRFPEAPEIFYRAFVDGLQSHVSEHSASCPAGWPLDDFRYDGGKAFRVEIWEVGSFDSHLWSTVSWGMDAPVPAEVLHEQHFAGTLPSGDFVSLGFYPVAT